MNIKKSYTFNDLLLIPQKSNILPDEVDLKTKLTKNIVLNIPFVSAAMDTVTESKMAIAIALEGGIGIIHKNLTITQQVVEIEKVKRNKLGFIKNPITLTPGVSIANAYEIMVKYCISGLPIINNDELLLGIITNRDIKACENKNEPVENYMTKNLIITHENIELEEAKKILLKNRIEKLPVVNSNNKLVGLVTIKDIDNYKEFPNACKDQYGRLRVGAAVGISNDTLERVRALVKANVDVVVIDSAHGHNIRIIDMVKSIRMYYPNLDIIAGNIVTKEAAEDLINAGVNAVKVGIGSGSICTTRIISGVGVPQVTAISEVYKVCKKYGIPVIADGGIKYSGDVVKALAAGANAVMMGSIFASSIEASGEEIIIDGKKYKSYIGMGTITAMKKGSSERYFQDKRKKFVSEGIEARVALKGKVSDILYQFVEGIKSGFGYCGAKSIKILQRTAKFIEISNNGLKESHPHGVEITKEELNYGYNK